MKNEDGYHEIEVISQEFIPNRKNPKKVKIAVKAEIDGEGEVELGPKTFDPEQVAEGRWEKHFVREVERREGDLEIPDLEGEKVKNTGYDHTGPERDYPGREK